MTPFAHEIVKDSLQPIRDRRFGSVVSDLRLLDGVHFFECSAVGDAAVDLGNDLMRRGFSEKLAFLPAPRTWIEFAVPGEGRVALLLEEFSDTEATVQVLGSDDAAIRSTRWPNPVCLLPLRGNPNLGRWQPSSSTLLIDGHRQFGQVVTTLYGFLAMINTPRVIMRRQHMPHRGLERRLVAARGALGSWPLQGWSEIRLEVRPPDISEEEHEAHFTGAKALHFVRAHLRIRLGRLELVSAHWRGDGALGIKQSRYVVVPSKRRRAA